MPRLVSLNVGLPRDVAWEGRTVHTGIWKYPVDGPRMVRRLNIDGDGQGDLAGHGGEQRAVLVYQLDSYRYWAEQLHRDDLEYGQFGENFTVDGLPDDEVHVGDRYRIGEAEFEVTQPRVTWRIQPVSATPGGLSCSHSSWSSASAGVFQPSRLRGRLLSSMATVSRMPGPCTDKSVPLGKY